MNENITYYGVTEKIVLVSQKATFNAWDNFAEGIIKGLEKEIFEHIFGTIKEAKETGKYKGIAFMEREENA